MAGGLSITILYSDLWWNRKALKHLLAGLFALLAGLLILLIASPDQALAHKVLSKFSKSGDVEEITTATGRTVVWAEAIEQIKARPAFGYGLNSTTVLLLEHLQSAHNAVLYIAISGGVVAGALMLMIQLQLLWNLVACPSFVIRSLSIFLFIGCLFEDTVWETFVGPATILFFVVYLYPAIVPGLRFQRLDTPMAA